MVDVFALILIIGLISLGIGLLAGVLGGLGFILTTSSQTPFLIINFFLTLFLVPWSTATFTFAYLQLRKKKGRR